MGNKIKQKSKIIVTIKVGIEPLGEEGIYSWEGYTGACSVLFLNMSSGYTGVHARFLTCITFYIHTQKSK